jgi:hypothetical protein
MIEQLKAVVDYALLAHTALEAVEDLNKDLVKLADKRRKSREWWRVYGQALLDQRHLMPADQDFGSWVRNHGLDTGLASHPGVRSDAIWLAKNWTAFPLQDFKPRLHHPVAIRHAWRASTKTTTKIKHLGPYRPPGPEVPKDHDLREWRNWRHLFATLESCAKSLKPMSSELEELIRRGALPEEVREVLPSARLLLRVCDAIRTRDAELQHP